MEKINNPKIILKLRPVFKVVPAINSGIIDFYFVFFCCFWGEDFEFDSERV
jgi:hypothetical protein